MGFDLRLAIRSLRRQPALSLAVMLTVGLAVAGNTALFSIFDGLLFRPLPYPGADRLVHVEVPLATRRTLPAAEVRALDDAVATTPLFDVRGRAGAVVLIEDGAADVTAWQLRPAEISPRILSLLGAVPAAGRLLTDEDRGASPRRIMIGFDLWQTRFGGSESVFEAPVEIPGVILKERLQIVGVMPSGLAFPDGANLWLAGPASGRANIARLAPGVTIDQVRAALPRAEIVTLRDYIRPDGAIALAVLLAATGCLLLIAWAQVAALLFARAAGRMSEVGVRLALGASRARLLRQFVAEGAVLAAGALAVAWLLAPALTSALIHLLPDETVRGQSLSPDVRTFIFSVVISAAGIVVLSFVPAALVRRSSPLDLLRTDGFGRATAGAARARLGMLAAQLAVTTTLLYITGLAIRSFDAIAGVDLGFDPDRVVAVQLPPTTVVGTNAEERRANINRQIEQWNQSLESLRELPGITAVGGGRLPFYSSVLLGGANTAVISPLRPDPILADYFTLTPDYVRVMRLRVVDGRVPGEDELGSAGSPVPLGAGTLVVINEAMARALAPLGPVVGQRLTVSSRAVTVAAVVADFATVRPDLPIAPAVLLLQPRPQGGYVLARVADDASMDEALIAIRTTMDRIWPANPSREVMVVSDLGARALADYRSRAVLLGLIGVLCLPLAFAGVTGAVSYAVAQRRREIGLRMALGAGPADIRRTILGRGTVAVVLGLAAGIGAGVGAGRAMTAFLFGVQPANLATMLAVAGVLVIVAVVAMWVPARHAMRVEAADALRA